MTYLPPLFASLTTIGIDPMTKFGYDSLNFVKMFTLLPINAKRENFAFLDNI